MGQLARDGHELERPTGTVRTYAPASGELLAELPVTSDDGGAAHRGPRAQGAGGVGASCRSRSGPRACCACATPSPTAREDLVDLLSRECGKPRHEALVHEVMTLLDSRRLVRASTRPHPRARAHSRCT